VSPTEPRGKLRVHQVHNSSDPDRSTHRPQNYGPNHWHRASDLRTSTADVPTIHFQPQLQQQELCNKFFSAVQLLWCGGDGPLTDRLVNSRPRVERSSRVICRLRPWVTGGRSRVGCARCLRGWTGLGSAAVGLCAPGHEQVAPDRAVERVGVLGDPLVSADSATDQSSKENRDGCTDECP
jgi:hypothetical protein